MTSQKVPFQDGPSHRDSVFTHWNQAKLEKNHFLCLKTSFLAQIYTPPLHFHGFKAKQTNSYVQFFEKTTAATLW